MLVNELIAGSVLSCTADTTAVEAAKTMIDNDSGSLAVLDQGDLVGIVTERDLIGFLADRGTAGDGLVGEVMTPSPDSLAPDVEVAYAADWMLAAGYRHLPVVDGDRLVGMLSIKDVLWGLTQGRRDAAT